MGHIQAHSHGLAFARITDKWRGATPIPRRKSPKLKSEYCTKYFQTPGFLLLFAKE